MKIVKELDANEWVKSLNTGFAITWWAWGLGDDGNLYGKGKLLRNGKSISTILTGKNDWVRYDHLEFGIPLREMKRIVKEFGHLVIFT